MRPLLLLFACLLGTAGCDSSGPTPAPETPTLPAPAPPAPGPPNFSVTGLPDHLDYVAGDTDRFSLTAFFEPALPADIEVTASSPSTLVNLRTYARFLDITALESGTSVLELHATASGYRDTTLSIPLTVTGSICPPRGDRDLVPAIPGYVWRFSYLDEDARRGAVTEGTVTFLFTDMMCSGKSRYWGARVKLDATETSASATRPVVAATSAYLSEDPANHFALFLNPIQNLSNTASFLRYRAEPGDTAVLTTVIQCAGVESPPAAASMTFEVGVGLVAEMASCGSGPTLHRREMMRLQ